MAQKGRINAHRISFSGEKTTNWKSIYIIAFVAFLSMLEMAAHSEWNYFCQLNSSATVTFYGVLRTVGAVFGGFSTLVAGWICNKLQNTRQVLILSQVLVFIAYCFLLALELVHGFLFYSLFLFYKILLGISGGAGSQSRTHIAMASNEGDRGKAIALCSLFPAIGMLIGFLINMATSYLTYPGLLIPLVGIHLNLFTAPILFAMIIFLFAFYLLVYHFDGNWQHYNGTEMNHAISKSNNKEDKTLADVHRPLLCQMKVRIMECFCGDDNFDWIAIIVCCFTQIAVSLAILVLTTISAPYQQIAFNWDAADLQFYSGIGGACVAIQLILWPTAYMVFGLNKIISERNSVILSLFLLLGGFLLTYSWPFLPETIQYDGYGTAANFSTSVVVNSFCGDQSAKFVGCPAHYTWCPTTTKPNVIVYMVALIMSMGASMPILRLNLDTLYSKILGNIKQGVMQSIFVVCTNLLEIAGGSIVISWIFENDGPKRLWEAIMLLLILCLSCWLIFYKRMISNSQRISTQPTTKS